MVNSIFEKCESDLLARIAAYDAEYDKFSALDKEVGEIVNLFSEGAFRDEDEYALALKLAYKRFGVTEHQYHDWCQKMDEAEMAHFYQDNDDDDHHSYDLNDGLD